MIIGWQLHAYDVPHIRRVVEAAPDYGVNHLQLSHDIVMYLKHVTGDALRPRLFNEIIDMAHRRGIEVFLWAHVISHVPDEFVVDSRANLDHPGLWEHEAGEWSTLLRLVPDVDGMILSFGDCCHYHMYNDNQVVSQMPKDQRLLRYIKMARDALASRGKALYVRDWAGGSWTVRAIHQAPPDVAVMTKTDIGDWYQTDPHNPHIGAFPERRQLIEFDLSGEYMGRWTPWCAPEYIRYRWRHAQERGAIGAVGRIDVYDLGHHLYCNPFGSVPSEAGPNYALDTPNEINVFAFTRIVTDPNADTDGIWQDWAEGRYGPAAAPQVVSVLKRSVELATKVFLRRAYVNIFKTLPTLGFLERISRTEGVIGHPLEDFAYEETLEEAFRDEYGDVEALLVSCLDEIERARPNLDPARYAELRRKFENLQWYMVCWRQMHLVFIRYKLYELQGQPPQHERLNVEMQRLLDLAKTIETRYGPNYWPTHPGRIRQFVAEVREVTNYFQKQLLRQTSPDIEVSLFIPR